MKKALSLILAFVMCLSLCACGEDGGSSNQSGTNQGAESKPDTAAVGKVINMIDELEVSLTSGKAISAAEKAYADLTAEQKNSVTNYQSLVDAKASYERILNVFTLIEAIGTVNKDSEPAIVAAEEAYKALSIEERTTITNASVLTAARATFDSIPIEVTLTVENIKDYFTIEHSSTTSKKDIAGRYGRAISGNVVAKQCVTLAGIENVTITVRVTCSVGFPVDGSLNSENEYKTYEYDVVISISAINGSGSASYKTDGHYVSKYWYPSIDVASVEVISVTGAVTVAK